MTELISLERQTMSKAHSSGENFSNAVFVCFFFLTTKEVDLRTISGVLSIVYELDSMRAKP